MPETYAYTTPKYLLPQMEDVPATEPAFYRSLFILDRLGPRDTAAGDAALAEGPPPTSNTQELTAPIDPFDGRGEEFETLPAVGVLTVHQQGWVQKGIALGNLIQSICLAPGEVTQVAVIDWRRTTTGTSEEATQQGETVTSDISQQRAVNEVQRAVAEEAQRGGSSTSATSAALQSGLAVSTLVASGSVSSAVNTSSALDRAVQHRQPQPCGRFDQCTEPADRRAFISAALAAHLNGARGQREGVGDALDAGARQLQPPPHAEC